VASHFDNCLLSTSLKELDKWCSGHSVYLCMGEKPEPTTTQAQDGLLRGSSNGLLIELIGFWEFGEIKAEVIQQIPLENGSANPQ
jgi:hypothetical protein